ncbi:MAG: hypothetical protein QW500_00280 [Candidatus Micrarchaeia archaeon]
MSRCLPRNTLLYVKPHPHFSGSDIPLQKIIALSKLKNVKVINHNTNSKDLYTNCLGVITIAGTSGFEGILYEKPVIVFGKPFYSQPGTVLRVEDMMDFPSLLINVIKDPNYGINKKMRKKMVADYFVNQVPLESKSEMLEYIKISENDATNLSKAFDESYRALSSNNK